jgi:GcrA cell cycle regulator
VGTVWSEARIRVVKRLWAEGASSGEIAEELGEGFTRGAVLGKIRRLGLSRKESAPEPIVLVSTKPATVEAGLPDHPKQQPAVAPQSVFLPSPQPSSVARGLRIWDLRDHHCRWPLGADCPPKLFCGAPAILGSSWCAEHRRLAYPRGASVSTPPIGARHVASSRR